MLSLKLQQVAFEGIRLCRDLRHRIDDETAETDPSAEAMRRAFGVLEIDLLRLLAESPVEPAIQFEEGSSSSPKKNVSGLSRTRENS